MRRDWGDSCLVPSSSRSNFSMYVTTTQTSREKRTASSLTMRRIICLGVCVVQESVVVDFGIAIQ